MMGHRKRVLQSIAGLGHGAPAAERPSERLEVGAAERRQLTVMFVDLVGSTALAARLDPEETQRGSGPISADRRRMRFRGPTARQVAWETACWPISAGPGRMRTRPSGPCAPAWPRGGGCPDRGTTRGSTRLPGRDRDRPGRGRRPNRRGRGRQQVVVGETPNLAARLQAIAEPGQVVVRADRARCSARHFGLDDLGAQLLRGIRAGRRLPGVGEGEAGSRFEARHGARRCRWSVATRSWRCCSSAGGRPRPARARACSSSARPGSASPGSCGRCATRWRTRGIRPCATSARPTTPDTPLWPVIAATGASAGPRRRRTPEVGKLERCSRGASTRPAAPLVAVLFGLDGTGAMSPHVLTPQRAAGAYAECSVDHAAGARARTPGAHDPRGRALDRPTSLELLQPVPERVGGCAGLLS